MASHCKQDPPQDVPVLIVPNLEQLGLACSFLVPISNCQACKVKEIFDKWIILGSWKACSDRLTCQFWERSSMLGRYSATRIPNCLAWNDHLQCYSLYGIFCYMFFNMSNAGTDVCCYEREYLPLDEQHSLNKFDVLKKHKQRRCRSEWPVNTWGSIISSFHNLLSLYETYMISCILSSFSLLLRQGLRNLEQSQNFPQSLTNSSLCSQNKWNWHTLAGFPNYNTAHGPLGR